MKVEIERAVVERLDDIVSTFAKLTAAIEANTAALQARNAMTDYQLNGPRG